MKNIETIILDPQIIECKLKELRSMLETVKSSESSPHMVPLIEAAIEANEKHLRDSQCFSDLQRKMPKQIILRATGLDTWAKDRHCSGSYYQVGDHYVFELGQTKRWFGRCKFPPRTGYLLLPEDTDCIFEIRSISFLDNPPLRKQSLPLSLYRRFEFSPFSYAASRRHFFSLFAGVHLALFSAANTH